MGYLKQSALIAGSRLVDKAMNLVVILILSRHFGEQGLGEFNYYFSLVCLFKPVTELASGFILLQRWHERDVPGRRLLLTQLIVLKVLLVSVVFGFALAGDAINHWGLPHTLAVGMALLTLFSDELADLLRRPAHAEGVMWPEAVFPLVSRIIQLTALLAWMNSMTSSVQALYIYAAGNGIEALLSIMGSRGYPPTLAGARRADWWDIVRNAFPFALSQAFMMATLHFDSVMLGHYDFKDVGGYTAAARIVMVAAVLNGGICHALFPKIIAAKAENNPEHIGWLMNGTLRGFTILFGAIAIGGVIVGRQLMLALYGPSFTKTGLVFQCLSPLILTAAYYSLLGQCIEILGEQRKAMRIYAISAVLNVLGNVALIPFYGIYGSAAATVLSSLYTVAMLFIAMTRNEHITMTFFGMGRAVLFLIILTGLYLPLYNLDAVIAVPLGAALFAALLFPFRSYWLEGLGKITGPLPALWQ